MEQAGRSSTAFVQINTGSRKGPVVIFRSGLCSQRHDFNMRELHLVTVQRLLPLSWTRSRGYSSNIDARRKISVMELDSFYAGLDLKKQLTSAEASVSYSAWS